MTTAAEAAGEEARAWAAVAADWAPVRCPGLWAMRSATEAAVVRFHDPRPDLERRARRWSYPLGTGDLADLARFAAALAATEAEAWAADDPHVATRAYEERRFLAGDRILHWAVPWLHCLAGGDAPEPLLDLGDRLRPAPGGATCEGLAAPGEDAFGPVEPPAPRPEFLRSVWSGLVLTEAQVAEPARRLAGRYEAAAGHWRELAGRRPGTARLWHDLAARAAATAEALAPAEDVSSDRPRSRRSPPPPGTSGPASRPSRGR